MSCDKDSEISEFKSEKPVKRVRFSEEISSVYEYELEEIVGNFPAENESRSVSDEFNNPKQNEFSTEESLKNVMESVDTTDASNSNKYVSECTGDNEDDRFECNKHMETSVDSCNDDCYLQCDESSAHNYSPVPDYFNNNNNSDMVDLNLLIRETKHLTISSPDQVMDENQKLSSGVISKCSSCESESEKIVLQAAEPPKCNQSCFTRKRSSEGMLIERQTSKLNVCLRNDNSEISSAVDLKNAVFNAWNKVKKDSANVKNVSFVPEVKEKVDASAKPSDRQLETRYYGKLKNYKRNAKKANFKESEPVPQKKKDDDFEESKMAFRAWKKKKDELSNQQVAEKHKKEERKRLDSLMNERMRKNDAESAYLAWISHKAVVLKMEKKKSQWLLEREKEKLSEKVKRNDDAAKIYYKWLSSKIFSKTYNSHKLIEDKPPWTPPGKINSFI